VGKPPPLRLTELPPQPEHDLQRALKRALSMELAPPGEVSDRGVVWWSVDHAHYAGVPGTRVGRGVIAGQPDILVVWEGRAFFIELKRKHGVLSEPQRSLLISLFAASCQCGVATSIDQVLRLLDVWGVPRRGFLTVAA
jgi:hypothetical protein